MSTAPRSSIKPRRMTQNLLFGHHRTARIASILGVAFLVISFFAAQTNLASIGKEANTTTAKGFSFKPAVGSKVTSASLAKSLRRGAAYTAKSAKAADKKLVDAKMKRQAPFFAALKKTDRNLKDLEASLKSKDDKKFFKAMDRTGKSVNELDTAFRLSGIKDPKITEGVKKIGDAFKTLRKNYGKEALRKKKGGPLTPKETDQAKALEGKYRKALADLDKLKAKSANSKAPGAKASNVMLNSLSKQIAAALAPPKTKPAAGGAAAGAPAAAGPSLAGFTRLMMFEEDFVGSWYAISSFVMLEDPKGYASFGYGAFNSTAADIYSYTTSVETSFEYSSAEYWSYSESTSVEVTESYEVSISESEIAQSEAYLESVEVESLSVDEYDVTLGEDDVAMLDHDDDGIIDSKDDDDDGDGTPDAKDLDDDGDGISDVAEEDSDRDGTPDALDDDDDNDGLDDDADKDDDGDGTADDKEARDNDNDGTADDKDADDDNDGTPDAKDADDDGDGVDDAEDSDDDNDGVDDSEDSDHDNDGDGTPDGEDTDDDNDGTADEADTDDDGDGESDAEEAEEEAETEEEPEVEEPEEEEPEEEEPEEEEPEEDDDSGDDDDGMVGV